MERGEGKGEKGSEREGSKGRVKEARQGLAEREEEGGRGKGEVELAKISGKHGRHGRMLTWGFPGGDFQFGLGL